eukprot:COSAG01_NODE_47091_length_393_cov_11.394558_1_plen_47_part_10
MYGNSTAATVLLDVHGSTSYYSCSTWPLDLATSSMLAAVAQLHAPGK